MSYLQAAFDAVCSEAVTPESWYVSLVESVPYYGGPEEGGWWGRDTQVVAFQVFSTETEANAKAEAVKKLAEEMSQQAKQAYGEQCLRETEWCESRGLDADWLGEVDGETEYSVIVSEKPLQASHGCRHYE